MASMQGHVGLLYNWMVLLYTKNVKMSGEIIL